MGMRRWNIRLWILLAVVLLPLLAVAQEGKTHKARYVSTNLPTFDWREYHFGFILGLNRSDFVITRKFQPTEPDSLLVLENVGMPGFNLGIVSTYRFTKNIRVRFVPTLSFQDRKLVYHFTSGDSLVPPFEKIVEATFVELPVYIKLRTDRIGNFAPYIIGGAKYMIDMSSKKDVESLNDQDLLVKTQKFQVAAEFGGGFDFFLPYFKFGIELKMSLGLGNVLIPEDHRFSSPLDKLVPKGYTFTLTFEG